MPTYKRLIIAWFFVPLHRLLFRLSGGRLLSRLEGEGVLILVTTGRRSGKPRSSPLMRRVRRIVIAELRWTTIPRGIITAGPNVSVETSGGRFAAEARITHGEERTALFDLRRILRSRILG